ncbi:MAG: cytochrome c [Chloroflexi bacterium]|nr:cytochrome c [Chloroflexota bacterium]
MRWYARVGWAVVLVLLGAGCGSQLSLPAAPSGTGAPAVSTPSPDAAVARGGQLYATHCQQCHGDRNGAGRVSPAPPHNQDGHTWHHADQQLVDIILNGSGDMGEMMRRMMGVPADAPRMPAWRGTLSEEDVRAVLAFIKTWWTPEQRRMQAQAPMMR